MQAKLKLTAEETAIGFNELTAEEQRVILDKGTEQPFTGKYCKFDEKGDYLCKRCGRVVNRFSALRVRVL